MHWDLRRRLLLLDWVFFCIDVKLLLESFSHDDVQVWKSIVEKELLKIFMKLSWVVDDRKFHAWSSCSLSVTARAVSAWLLESRLAVVFVWRIISLVSHFHDLFSSRSPASITVLWIVQAQLQVVKLFMLLVYFIYYVVLLLCHWNLGSGLSLDPCRTQRRWTFVWIWIWAANVIVTIEILRLTLSC